jgi:hypothetical protein
MRPSWLVGLLLLDQLIEIERLVEPLGFERLGELGTKIGCFARAPEHNFTLLDENP